MQPDDPFHWMRDTSGVLRPAVMAYLNDDDLTAEQIAALRAYLRQWIAHPVWRGNEIPILRKMVDRLTSGDAIAIWLAFAQQSGIDPL